MNRKGRVREALRPKLKAAPRIQHRPAELRQWCASLSAKHFTEFVTLRDITAVQCMGKLNSKLMQRSVSSGEMQSAANLDVPLLTATELCTLLGF